MESLYELFESTAARIGLDIDTYRSNNIEHPILTKGGAKVRVTTYYKKIKEHVFSSMVVELKDVISDQDRFQTFLVDYCKATNKYTSSTKSKITDFDEAQKMEGMTLCRDISYSSNIYENRFFLLNKEGNISDIPASHYIAVMGIKVPNEESRGVLPIYLPYAPQGTFEHVLPTGETVLAANSYLPPKYMPYLEAAKPELPEEVEILFSQIRGEMDRKFFRHFLSCCIKSKNTGFLVIQGFAGLGKSYMKNVFKALVGSRNYAEGKRSAVIGNFNTNILNTRLTILDEFKYSFDDLPALKELPNNEMSIEEKFKSTQKTVKMYSNFMIMNNKESDNKFSFDDRKFFPLDSYPRRLEEILDPEKIKVLQAKVDEGGPDYDPMYVARIAKYLLVKGYNPKLFPQGEYKGPRFWALCHSSMSAWQRVTIELLSDPVKVCGAQIGNQTLEKLEKGELLFSAVKNIATKVQASKKEDKRVIFPNDFSAAYDFLTIFKDLSGNSVFYPSQPHDKVLGDFMIAKIKTSSAEDAL